MQFRCRPDRRHGALNRAKADTIRPRRATPGVRRERQAERFGTSEAYLAGRLHGADGASKVWRTEPIAPVATSVTTTRACQVPGSRRK